MQSIEEMLLPLPKYIFKLQSCSTNFSYSYDCDCTTQICFCRDIFSLTKDPQLFKDCTLLLVEHVQESHPNADIIAGLDSRGFIFGSVIAHHLNLPFVPIRKRGKLPGDTFQASYSLEYGDVCFVCSWNAIVVFISSVTCFIAVIYEALIRGFSVIINPDIL